MGLHAWFVRLHAAGASVAFLSPGNSPARVPEYFRVICSAMEYAAPCVLRNIASRKTPGFSLFFRKRNFFQFDLMLIARYFPEFERALPGYLNRK
jgi:hypothetical protein